MKEIQTHPAPQPGQPDCCTCTYCREMLEGEKACCNENSEIFFVGLYRKISKFLFVVLNYIQIKITHNNIMSK
jgi:hypothetical protein